MLRKLITTFCIALFALAMGVGSGAQAENDAVKRIQDAGKLRVAITPTALGFNFMDPNSNELVGVNVEMAKIFATELGVEVELIPMPFGALFEHLLADRSDIVMSAVLIRPDRQEMFNFTDPPYAFGYTVITRADDDRQYKNIQEVVTEYEKGEIKVGEQTNSAFVGIVKDAGVPTVDIQLYENKQDAIRDLALGRIDVTFWDKPIIEYFAHLNPDVAEKIRIEQDFESPKLQNGYPIRFEDGDLLEFINSTIDKMKEDGSLAALVEQFGMDPEMTKN